MFHVELAPLGGIFGPLKSDIGVFWPFWGTDFIMGKNHNSNFSKRARQNFLIFSLSSLFISVLKVPEEKLAVHNFWGWVLSGGSVSRWTSCRISLGDRTIQNQSHRRKDKCCFVFRLICFEGLRDKMQNKSNWHIFWFLLWVVLFQLNRVGSKESGELKRLGVGKSGRWTI